MSNMNGAHMNVELDAEHKAALLQIRRPLDVEPLRIALPFAAIKELAAQIMLLECQAERVPHIVPPA